MFGTLKNILKEDWYSKEENKKVTFITFIASSKSFSLSQETSGNFVKGMFYV